MIALNLPQFHQRSLQNQVTLPLAPLAMAFLLMSRLAIAPPPMDFRSKALHSMDDNLDDSLNYNFW